MLGSKKALKCTRQFVISLVSFLFAFLGGGVTHSQTPARDGYIGIVSKADGRKSGEQFTFANLRSQRPFVTFPSGNGEETTKVFEDNETIVLIFVAHLTGSTETLYLNKKPNVLRRFMEDKYSSKKAIHYLLQHHKKLSLKGDALEVMRKSQDFYHKYSHVTKMTLAAAMPFSQKGELYLGASFDDGKLDAYKKEVNLRVSLADAFPNFVDGVSVNVAKW